VKFLTNAIPIVAVNAVVMACRLEMPLLILVYIALPRLMMTNDGLCLYEQIDFFFNFGRICGSFNKGNSQGRLS